jgi:hypothetical protein
MDLYDKPVENAYRTGRFEWFEMPRLDGTSRTVMAVSATEAQYWTIGYTILVGIIFAALSRLATILVLACYPEDGSGNLHVMLVAFYNANSPTTVLSQLFHFARHAIKSSSDSIKKDERNSCCYVLCFFLCFFSFPKKRYKINWNTLLYCLILASVALTLIACNTVAKFLVNGKQLIVRNAARASPDAIYYPILPTVQNNTALEILQPVRAAAAFQSAGRVEAAKGNIQKEIPMSSTTAADNEGRPTFKLSYSYSIGGNDMGLQGAPKLNYSVSGQCQTEYSWLNTTFLQDNVDQYPLWGSTYDTLAEAQVDSEVTFPPWVNVVPELNSSNRSKITHGNEFALVPSVSHRRSTTLNLVDPWYLTEETPGWATANATAKRRMRQYRIQRGRPPIHCWQNSTWSLGNTTVYHVDDLYKLPGLRLSRFLRGVFEREFSLPPVIQVSNNLGYAALSSAMDTVVNKREIVASRCSASRDLERLIQINFVSSRDAVRNIVLLYSNQRGLINLENLAADKDGRVPNENADFILESKDVAALSARTLVAVPAVCAFLWLVVWIQGHMGDKKVSNHGRTGRLNLRRIALRATQLYRYLDEELSGESKWSGRLSAAPYVKKISNATTTPPKYSKTPVSVHPPRQSNELGATIPDPEKHPSVTQGREINPSSSTGEQPSTSHFIVPKLLPINEPEEPTKPQFLERICNAIKFWQTKKVKPRYQLVMTNSWQKINKKHGVDLKDIVNSLNAPEGQTSGDGAGIDT